MSNDAWENARELAERHSSAGGLFVRLANDGDKVVGCFLGSPFAREVHWNGERYVECAGKRTCSLCGEGIKASLRTSMNFYVLTEQALKVVEGGVAWFKDLIKCREKYGLERWSFELERHGASGDPKTHYSILPDEKLSDEQQRQLARLELHDLKALASGVEPEPRREQPNSSGSSPRGHTIDQVTAEALMARLKIVPRPIVSEFLQRFRIARVRDLQVADVETAFEFLEAKSPAQPAEVAPFE